MALGTGGGKTSPLDASGGMAYAMVVIDCPNIPDYMVNGDSSSAHCTEEQDVKIKMNMQRDRQFCVRVLL